MPCRAKCIYPKRDLREGFRVKEAIGWRLSSNMLFSGSLRISGRNILWLSSAFLPFLAPFISHSGLRPPFSEAPNSVVYAEPGSTVTLVWNYDHDNVKLVTIKYMKAGEFKPLVAKDSIGKVLTNPSEPASLTSRVTIKDNATFVIRNFTNNDSTKYSCEVALVSGSPVTADPVDIAVASK